MSFIRVANADDSFEFIHLKSICVWGTIPVCLVLYSLDSTGNSMDRRDPGQCEIPSAV